MTDFVAEMMETAGCEEKRCPNNVYDELCKKYEFCNNAPHCKIYPDFTAEKQLEVIKLIIEAQGFCGFTNFQDNDKYSISCGFNFPVGPNPAMGINFNPTFRKCETLEAALAQLTTELMNAGELDKEKVREILQ